MPIKRVIVKGKPAYKWGDTGKAYTYTSGDEASRKRAKKRAIKQSIAAGEMPGKGV